jgi:DNA-binding NarL/FixJ family response regulator
MHPPEPQHAHATMAMLTQREAEVVPLVAQGLTNTEIAAHLGLTEGTVSNHVGHVLRKTGARNRVQVAVWLTEYRLCGACR